jgi:hypothetical protein
MLYYAALSNCYTFEKEKIPQQDSVSNFEEIKQEGLPLPENSEEDLPLPENPEEEKVPKEYDNDNDNEGGSDEEHSIVLTNTNMLKGPKQF